ncbi:PTS transporter subunit EIIC [Candidatus Mycoplasma pogonae]
MFSKLKNNNFDWNDVSEKVIASLGGKANIKSIYHCATRLRVVLHDKTKINKQLLNVVPLAKGHNITDEEVQIIFGAGTVNKVHDNFAKFLNNLNLNQAIDAKPAKAPLWNYQIKWHSNIFLILRKALRSFAEIFIPLIPIFIAGGLSLALNSLFNTINKTSYEGKSQDLINLAWFFELIGGAILGSLPAFVGYTAMKKYGGNPILGLAIGIIMIFPGLINGWSSGTVFESLPIGTALKEGAKIGQTHTYSLFPSAPAFFRFDLIGYQAQVFPVLLIVALGYWIERLLKRITPEFLAIIVVPFFTVIGATFLGFLFVGPLGRYIGIGIGIAINALYTYTNWSFFGLGGLIIGLVYPFMVLTGLHQGILPIETQLLTQTRADYGHSFTWITPIATVSNIAQGMVGLFMIILLFKKSPVAISKAVSGGISANLGITEPILFGVNLPSRFGLLAASLASGVAGFWLGMTHTVANSQGSASWLGIAVQFDYFVSENYQAYLTKTGASDLLPNLAPVAKIAIGAVISTVFSGIFTFVLGKFAFKKQLADFIAQNQSQAAVTLQ